MSASCYLCDKGFGTIPGEYVGDALGVCNLCGVLACNAHALHNPNVPAYRCGLCLPNLLAVAAAQQGSGKGQPGTAPLPGDPPQGGSGAGYAVAARGIERVEDVIPDIAGDRWSGLRDDASYLTRSFVDSEAPEPVRAMAGTSDVSRELMAAAIALAVHLRLPSSALLPTLQAMAAAMQRHV